MAYQSWSVVYGEQPSASKWNILGTNDAHFYSFLGANEAWTSYTPTISNFTQGASTITGAYCRVGNSVRASVEIVLGAGFSISSTIYVSLPVTAASDYATTSRGGTGWTRAIDTSGSNYFGTGRIEDTTRFYPYIYTVNGATYAGSQAINSTAPFTWASTDRMFFEWEYEAA